MNANRKASRKHTKTTERITSKIDSDKAKPQLLVTSSRQPSQMSRQPSFQSSSGRSITSRSGSISDCRERSYSGATLNFSSVPTKELKVHKLGHIPAYLRRDRPTASSSATSKIHSRPTTGVNPPVKDEAPRKVFRLYDLRSYKSRTNCSDKGTTKKTEETEETLIKKHDKENAMLASTVEGNEHIIAELKEQLAPSESSIMELRSEKKLRIQDISSKMLSGEENQAATIETQTTISQNEAALSECLGKQDDILRQIRYRLVHEVECLKHDLERQYQEFENRVEGNTKEKQRGTMPDAALTEMHYQNHSHEQITSDKQRSNEEPQSIGWKLLDLLKILKKENSELREIIKDKIGPEALPTLFLNQLEKVFGLQANENEQIMDQATKSNFLWDVTPPDSTCYL